MSSTKKSSLKKQLSTGDELVSEIERSYETFLVYKAFSTQLVDYLVELPDKEADLFIGKHARLTISLNEIFFDSMVVSLRRIIDSPMTGKHEKTLSIHSMIESLFEEEDEILENFKTIRNKQIGHLEKTKTRASVDLNLKLEDKDVAKIHSVFIKIEKFINTNQEFLFPDKSQRYPILILKKIEEKINEKEVADFFKTVFK